MGRYIIKLTKPTIRATFRGKYFLTKDVLIFRKDVKDMIKHIKKLSYPYLISTDKIYKDNQELDIIPQNSQILHAELHNSKLWYKFRQFDQEDVHKLSKLNTVKNYNDLLNKSLKILNKVVFLHALGKALRVNCNYKRSFYESL